MTGEKYHTPEMGVIEGENVVNVPESPSELACQGDVDGGETVDGGGFFGAAAEVRNVGSWVGPHGEASDL